jgi:hypothetical protein
MRLEWDGRSCLELRYDGAIREVERWFPYQVAKRQLSELSVG